MIKNEINSVVCPIIVSSIRDYSTIKHNILDLINSSLDYYSEENSTVELNLIKSDWHKNSDPDRHWTKGFFPLIQDNILETLQTIGYNSYDIIQAWFQQYDEKGSHGWHIHAGNFSGVVYVDLPDGAPLTTFCDPVTKKTFSPQATEGDIVIFPSFILHKSLPNRSEYLKTIISFNLNVGYPDEFYGDGIIE